MLNWYGCEGGEVGGRGLRAGGGPTWPGLARGGAHDSATKPAQSIFTARIGGDLDMHPARPPPSRALFAGWLCSCHCLTRHFFLWRSFYCSWFMRTFLGVCRGGGGIAMLCSVLCHTDSWTFVPCRLCRYTNKISWVLFPSVEWRLEIRDPNITRFSETTRYALNHSGFRR